MHSVHVPHRNSWPTLQIASPYDIVTNKSDHVLQRAESLAYSAMQDNSGYPELQADIMSQAVADIHFADEVDIAALRIANLAQNTDVYNYCGLIVKDETTQPTKAYKVRGAANFILKYADQAQSAGVVTASAGNHGQAVALAASFIGVEAVVVVPRGTPQIKMDGILAQGGNIVEFGANYAEASSKALEINGRQRGLFVPAFNHRDIMIGQATVARELLAQTTDLANVVVPTGGGGLLAGMARYLAVHAPWLRVYGAGVADGSAAETAFRSGNSGHTVANSFADGIAVDRLGDQTWPEIKRLVERVLTVNESSLRQQIGALSLSGHVLEAAGAVGIAAALSNANNLDGQTAVVATGGNIDAVALLACQQLVFPKATERLTKTKEFSTI